MKLPKEESPLEQKLALQIRGMELPAPEREYRFAAIHVGAGRGLRNRLAEAQLRDWKFDFAWPDHMLAVEVEGGGWSDGRHTRGKGFEEDLWKYHCGDDLGWHILRCAGALIDSGATVQLIAKRLGVGR